MAETRSPRYPSIPLAEALSKARMIYDKEHMSALTPEVAAEAMGYKGLNGASLKVLSSLRRFGLLEGRGDEVRISTDAQTLIIDDPKSDEYRKALARTALIPEVFSDLRRQYPGKASERNIAVYLEKHGFKPDAAETVAKNYVETMALVEDAETAYGDSEAPTAARPAEPQMTHPTVQHRRSIAEGPLPPMRVVQHGERLEIEAVVDLAELRKLKRLLDSYEQILIMMAGNGPSAEKKG